MTTNNFEILNYIDDEIYIYAQDGNIQFMNQYMRSLVGDYTLLQNQSQVTAFLRKSFKFINLPETDLISGFENYEIHEPNTNEYRSVKKTQLEDRSTMVTFKTRTQHHILDDQIMDFGYWELDVMKDSLFWSNEIFNIFNINPNKFTASYEMFFDTIHPDDRELVKAAYINSLKTKETYDITHRLLLKNKTTKYVHEKCYTVFDDEDNPVQSVGIVWDVTNQQKIENLLRENENKFRRFIQQLPQPITITDDKGLIVQVNNNFLEIYGYDSEELINKNPNIVNPGKQVYFDLGYSELEYKELFQSLWRDILNPEIGWWEGTVLNRKKNNELVWVKLKINTIFDKDMKVRFHIGQPVDITAMVKNENLSKLDFYKMISAMAEIRDNETGRHMMRVGVFSKLIAKKLGQSEKFCEDIEIFAPMHDLGKVGIADAILLAPRKLTEKEFKIMKTHTIIGYNIIKGANDFELGKDIVLSHHEQWNGSGYPYQLKGDSIPLSARITAVVDVYDALRSTRPYKRPWTHQETLALIERQSGLHFDPAIVKVFLAMSSTIEHLYEQLT